MGLIKKRLLFDLIVDGELIPNGLSEQSLIDQYLADGSCLIYRALPYSLEQLQDVEICDVADADTGVYPVCLHDPSFFTFKEITQLITRFDNRTLELVKRGNIQLTFFIEEEPYKDVYQVFILCTLLYTHKIQSFRIFSNIDPVVYQFTPYSHHFFNSADNEFEVSSASRGAVAAAQARFNVLQYSENTYDWRVFALTVLYQAGILHRSIFTYNKDVPLFDEHRLDCYDFVKQRMPTFLREIAPLVHSRLPLKGVFRTSRLSIVLEAYLDDSLVNYVYVTEKSYRPLWWQQPFVVIGQAHTLRWLHRRGYRTFAPAIDESYDTIEDDMSRLRAVVRELSRINAMSDDQFDELIHNCQSTVDHNYALLPRLKEQYIEHIFEERS